MRLRTLYLILIPLLIILILAFNYLYNLKNLSFAPENLLKDFPRGLANRGTFEKSFVQRYRFLGEGAHSFVFESQDGRYVLKLFRAAHKKPQKKWLREGPLFNFLIPTAKKQGSKDKWQTKFQECSARYVTAYDRMKEESGLLFLHFGESESLNVQLALEGPSGKIVHLELDKLPFIVQTKGELVPSRLASHIKRGDIQAAKHALTTLRQMLEARARKGITDERQCFGINFAFCGERALQIDVGKIAYDQKLTRSPDAEIQRVRANLQNWTQKHFPELAN